MAEDAEEIIARYRRVARLPDALFFFTFPMREQAVRLLQLQAGDSVLEVGCGSGANLSYLVQAVGPTGRVVGVDISPEMVTAARARVARAGWRNVTIVQAAAEELMLPDRYDALLLLAMHDVFTSTAALDRSIELLKPGGRVVAAGPKLASRYPGKLLGPLVEAAFRRFAVSRADRDRPWRLLALRVPGLQVQEVGPGVLFLAWGTIG